MLDSETKKFHDELIKDYTQEQLAYIKAFGQDDLGKVYLTKIEVGMINYGTSFY